MKLPHKIRHYSKTLPELLKGKFGEYSSEYLNARALEEDKKLFMHKANLLQQRDERWESKSKQWDKTAEKFETQVDKLEVQTKTLDERIQDLKLSPSSNKDGHLAKEKVKYKEQAERWGARIGILEAKAEKLEREAKSWQLKHQLLEYSNKKMSAELRGMAARGLLEIADRHFDFDGRTRERRWEKILDFDQELNTDVQLLSPFNAHSFVKLYKKLSEDVTDASKYEDFVPPDNVTELEKHALNMVAKALNNKGVDVSLMRLKAEGIRASMDERSELFKYNGFDVDEDNYSDNE